MCRKRRGSSAARQVPNCLSQRLLTSSCVTRAPAEIASPREAGPLGRILQSHIVICGRRDLHPLVLGSALRVLASADDDVMFAACRQCLHADCYLLQCLLQN